MTLITKINSHIHPVSCGRFDLEGDKAFTSDKFTFMVHKIIFLNPKEEAKECYPLK